MSVTDIENDLTVVSDDRLSRFKNKYDKLNQSWEREEFHDNYREVKQAISSIDDLIQGIQDDLAEIAGKRGHDSEYEKIKDEFGKDQYEDMRQQTLKAGHTPDLRGLRELDQKRMNLLQRLVEWRTLQLEFSRLAMERLFTRADSMHEKIVTGDVVEHIDEYIHQESKRIKSEVKSEVRQDFERDIAEMEQVVNAARNETKNAWRVIERLAEVVSDEKMREIAEEAAENGLEKFATSDGRVDLSGEQLEADSKIRERESARESAVKESSPDESKKDAEKNSEDTSLYELKGKDVDELKNTLIEMRDDPAVDTSNQSAVANHADISRAGIFQSNGCVMDRVYEEYGEKFGMPYDP